jgi:cobalt-precorrin-5B (C1)-methyltransferase
MRFPDFPNEAFIQMGDYLAFSLQRACRLEFKHLIVAAFFGKALKMAQGLSNTHASKGRVDFVNLKQWVQEETKDPILSASIANCNTAREALEILEAKGRNRVTERVGWAMLGALRKHAGSPPAINGLIYNYTGDLLWSGELKGEETK